MLPESEVPVASRLQVTLLPPGSSIRICDGPGFGERRLRLATGEIVK